MLVLSPITITDSMFMAGSIPDVDVDAGEKAWVSGQVVAEKDERVHNKYVWKCAHVPPDLTISPDKDDNNWQKMRPSNKWASFDKYPSTAQVGRKGRVDQVLKPGFFNGLALDNLKGLRLEILITDGVDGPNLRPPVSVPLRVRPAGWKSYWFGRKLQITKYRLDKLPLNPNAVIHITVTGAADEEVGIGWLSIGDWINFGIAKRGIQSGTLYGVKAEIENFAGRKDYGDGTFDLEPRGAAVNLTLPVMVDASEGNRLFDVVRRLMNKPVAVYASARDRDRLLSTVGLVSTDFTREITELTTLSVYVKGVLQYDSAAL
ncbi:hypothetical protein ACFIQF_13295 [Comamonas sp. J-3]|uniref:hypothetical protein n=1 Tax=Comamonas trifloxystrobinivorans TaxID=3350256 RepID=UPI003728C55C